MAVTPPTVASSPNANITIDATTCVVNTAPTVTEPAQEKFHSLTVGDIDELIGIAGYDGAEIHDRSCGDYNDHILSTCGAHDDDRLAAGDPVQLPNMNSMIDTPQLRSRTQHCPP